VPCPSRRTCTTALLATTAVLAVGMAGSSYAGTSSVIVNGTGNVGFATAPAVGSFGTVSLSNGGAQATAVVDPFVVTDTSLPANGWHVTIAATPFCLGAAPSAGATSCSGTGLPNGSLRVHAPTTVTAGSGGSGTAPTLLASTPTIDGGAGATIVSAPFGNTGTWNVGASSLVLTVASSTTPGTYSSTITYTAVQGP
jgi:hypothetical protein